MCLRAIFAQGLLDRPLQASGGRYSSEFSTGVPVKANRHLARNDFCLAGVCGVTGTCGPDSGFEPL
ncbi:hypothetical protein KIH86_05625 [Paenibacillus sp. HN-1]|uniref:hypothetical protein n=1 Tax=Paenibacillus TaxID=44249 RepID=UPI001CA9AE5E|nr:MULTISPECIES: hypothetical protein [Paenibacillus]MBY9077708.1 hypothetical protein [Paenibacillus sp. CGMCC 1.18879]MBY9083713.1 hypothetical protein [Paenibacillus sinensis]